MRYAVISDIHGNREALEAVLDDIEEVGADRIVCLGDVVGYGADPEAVTERVESLVAAGAVCLKGNHDAAIEIGTRRMNELAAFALDWTARRLGAGHKAFLKALPMAHEEGGVLFVHASAARPEAWTYVVSAEEAAESLAATDARLTFCGHVHVPALFSILHGISGTTGKTASFRPVADKPVPLSRIRRHLAVIDGFVLQERIAVGGMGAIWRVTHPDWSIPLVMKAPFLGAGADVSTILAYETEEMIMRRLEGRHVPRFIAAGDLRTLPYIVMEFVDGPVLESRLGREAFAPDEVARIGARIAAALVDLHRQHVVHLDLKTGNVILAERGAVLIDFGLARHDELPDLLGEESDVPMGTPATIAPEQLLGDRSRPESDLFALGCILYELATGEKPFGEPVSTSGQKRRLYKPPTPPRRLNGKVPRWLQEVILKCLEVDPADRYASAGQLLFDLRHPDQVPLTERADRAGGEGSFLELLRAFVGGRRLTRQPRRRIAVARRTSSAPVVVAAVDLVNGADPLAQEVRLHVARALSAEPGARLACLTVNKTRLVGEDPTHDARGRTVYVSRLVALKDWARPLDLPEDRVSFHVLEAVDPGNAIIDYVRLNAVDHVVMGARAAGALRRHLGSVSSAVVAECDCTVTVVRLKSDVGEEPGG